MLLPLESLCCCRCRACAVLPPAPAGLSCACCGAAALLLRGMTGPKSGGLAWLAVGDVDRPALFFLPWIQAVLRC